MLVNMVFTAAGLVNEAEIAAAVRKVEKEFAPDVVRIGYSIGDDELGGPAIFFRILISDDAGIDRLKVIFHPLSASLMIQGRTFENGLMAYFEYRTESEQKALPVADWN